MLSLSVVHAEVPAILLQYLLGMFVQSMPQIHMISMNQHVSRRMHMSDVMFML